MFTNPKIMMGKDELLEAIDLIEEENYEEAHLVLQLSETPEAAWLLACLYRREGDEWNANYWYDKAGRAMPSYSVETEIQEIRDLIENL